MASPGPEPVGPLLRFCRREGEGRDAAAVERWTGAVTSLASVHPPWWPRALPEAARAAIDPGPTLVLGIGGSALGARAALAIAAAGTPPAHPVRILDAIDPARVEPDLRFVQEHRATLLVVSKSGTTVEIRAVLDEVLRRGGHGRVVVVSDPGDNPIRADLAARGCEYRHVAMPAEVGGRYSMFTAAGLLPLHAAGLDPDAMLVPDPAALYSCLEVAVELLAFRERYPAATSILWCYGEALIPWAHWVQQLECESLGRRRDDGSRVGELVVPLRGPADQHSVAQLLIDGPRDKRVLFVDFDDLEAHRPSMRLERLRRAERESSLEALPLPAAQLLVGERSLGALGALMLVGMITTVLWAEHLGVSPYGQPAVEEIKRRIRTRLSGEPGPLGGSPGDVGRGTTH